VDIKHPARTRIRAADMLLRIILFSHPLPLFRSVVLPGEMLPEFPIPITYNR